jgi:predicted nucleic acid-binding protein
MPRLLHERTNLVWTDLGILLAAKQRGAIASLRAEINALSSLGFRANPQLVTAVLQSAGE